MKPPRSGARHSLLFYRRTMDRVWKSTLLLGIALVVADRFITLESMSVWGLPSGAWLSVAAVVAFALSIFAFFSRRMAYIQARQTSLNIVTPFLRLRISYKRMLSIHPCLTQQLFPPEKSSWAERNYLQPFYGKTVLVVEMKKYPLSPALLKLFLPNVMFARSTTALFLMAADWMQLSTEIDSFRGAWLQAESIARLERRH